MRCHCCWCVDAIAWNQTPTKRICPSQPPHIFSSSARSHLNKFLFMVSVPTFVEQIFAYDFDGVFFCLVHRPSSTYFVFPIFSAAVRKHTLKDDECDTCVLFDYVLFIFFGATLQFQHRIHSSHPFFLAFSVLLQHCKTMFLFYSNCDFLLLTHSQCQR